MKSPMNLLAKSKQILPQVVLLATLFSCSKQDLQETSVPNETNSVQTQESLAATASSATMYYEETFEGSDPFYPAYDLKERFAGSHSFQVVTNPAFAGAKAGRFELRSTDVEVSGGTRTEVRFPLPSTSDLNRWYSWSAYFPAADFKYDSEDEVLNQWHQGSGYSPSISLRVKADRLLLYVKPTTETTQKIDLGAVPKDKWTSFVFHINHADNSTGLIELWINGVKVLNRTGANSYSFSTFEAPRWNIGIYKSAWNGSQTTETTKRVVIYDNIRLGGKSETLATMSAGGPTSTTTTPTTGTTTPTTGTTTPTTGTTTPTTGTTTPTTGTTTPTTGTTTASKFFLVNANTEKDLMNIANGAVISLAKLGTSKLNIRTNLVTSGSVTFVLSGAQSKTFTDKAAPYALHGDSGTGNFYYGNWNPPAVGTYTLKATASNGTSATVTFTITK